MEDFLCLYVALICLQYSLTTSTIYVLKFHLLVLYILHRRPCPLVFIIIFNNKISFFFLLNKLILFILSHILHKNYQQLIGTIYRL